MSKFDNDEQKIHEMFSKITVDSSKLGEQVKNRLHEEDPKVTINSRKYWAKPAVVAIVMSLMLVVTVAATVGGGFDWFIEKFNPSFGGVVEPVEIYSEDQGVRMEVIGAQKYDNKAIVYLSLQDITGQNRLTEQTEFRDGFRVKMSPQVQESTMKADEIVAGSFSWSQEILYFNEDINTVYYEFNITTDSDTPLADPLQLGSFLIYFDGRNYENEPINLSLTDIDPAETTPVQKSQIWGGSGDALDNPSLFKKVALTPGHYADMPHGEEDQWVSNIGIIDGNLHVQIGQIFNQEFGSTDVQLSLKDPDGNLIPNDLGLVYLSDKDNQFIDLKKHDYGDAIYKYQEVIFSVNTENLSEYTLCFTGSVYSGVEGKWNVKANLSDPNQNMSIWTNDIPVEDHLFEHLKLSPLGLQVIGTYEEECLAGDMVVEVETTEGIIPLSGGGGSQNSENRTFDFSWDTKRPLDVSTVTAVIINGTRIPVK